MDISLNERLPRDIKDSVRTTSRGNWGHTDISVFKQLPGDIGDIRTSHRTNGFQRDIGEIRTSQCTIQTAMASRGQTDISVYEQIPALHSRGLGRRSVKH